MSDSPISFRPDAEQRRLLTELQSSGVTPSAAIRRGLELMAQARAHSRLPLHPLSVEWSEVEEVVERACDAATEVLDELFAGKGPIETHGISSNFRGLLADHVRAMLTGVPAAEKSHVTHLPPLLVRWDSFGRSMYPSGSLQGVTIMRPAKRVGDADTFLCGKRFVPLDKINVGELFTRSEVAADAYVRLLAEREESPADHPARLVVVDFSEDQLKLVGDKLS